MAANTTSISEQQEEATALMLKRWALLSASDNTDNHHSQTNEHSSTGMQQAGNSSSGSGWTQRMTLAGMSAALLLTPAEPAHAALIKNVPEWAQNVFGVLYLAFFGAFLLRVFNKRAKFATSTKLADDQKAAAAEDDGEKPPPSLLDTFGGSFVAFFIAAIFYSASVKIDDGFNGKALPDDYAIAQITITIRTIVSGLAYLATFVFGANAIGLFLLACKTVVTGVSDVVSPSSASSASSSAGNGGGSSNGNSSAQGASPTVEEETEEELTTLDVYLAQKAAKEAERKAAEEEEQKALRRRLDAEAQARRDQAKAEREAAAEGGK